MSYYFLDFDYEQNTKIAHKILVKKGSVLQTGCEISVDAESLTGRILNDIPDGVEKCSCCDAVEVPELLHLIYIPENEFIDFNGIAGPHVIVNLLRENCNSPEIVRFLADVIDGVYQH